MSDLEKVGWQFYQGGAWHFGLNNNSHRENTEKAGFLTRDVLAPKMEIHTQPDKQREEQIEKMCQSMPSKPRADSISYEHKKIIASALYDKGCRLIAPDEYVVKALTAKQYAALCSRFDLDCEQIDAVQRELGIKL